jgi:hypothetical protein
MAGRTRYSIGKQNLKSNVPVIGNKMGKCEFFFIESEHLICYF